MADTDPTLEPRVLKDRSGWYVFLLWPNGQSEHINGFATEAVAQMWIDTESKEWVAKRRSTRP